ncbi:Clp protease N-terminal domain-containing protein [Microbispora sp. H13382]|uniref:Clp protease N-terminal domain-containing protein n=1 Tax=Microbispora sp. H13382 TaxID=2729112 RepID=UPI0016007AB8|nr:Clp protease N-terminal domain-containing protein [Microbispora sp. H13382]
MFERFTDDARQVVKHAVEQARELRHGQAGTEHVLLGLLTPQTSSARLLAAHGIDHARVRAEIVRRHGDLTGGDIDAEALESIGIDLSAVREKVEGVFGPGALDRAPQRDRRGVLVSGWRVPFGPRARKVLELSLREALAMKSRSIRDGHILLGVIREGEGMGARILADAGVDLPALRVEVVSSL